MNILDTVLLENGVITTWIYTNSDGCISRKPRNLYSLTKVRDEFVELASTFRNHVINSNYVALIHYGQTAPAAFTIDDFDSLIFDTIPPEIVSIQIFIPAKGSDSNFRSFRSVTISALIIYSYHVLDLNYVIIGVIIMLDIIYYYFF